MAAKRKVTQRVQNYSPTLWEDGEITGKEALALLGSSGKGRERGKPAYSRQIPRKPKALNNANWMNLYPTPKSIQRAEGSQGENLLPFGTDPTEGSLSTYQNQTGNDS